MTAVSACARAELRARWRATLLLAVLVGVAGGVVLASVAGARRTATTMDRFLAYHQATNVGVEAKGIDLDAVARLPQVADAAAGGYLALLPASPSGAPNPDAFGEINPFVGLPDPLPATSNRPLLVAGRLPDRSRPLEVAVDETLAARRGVGPGRTLRMWAYTPKQAERMHEDDPGVPAGGAFDLAVTGVLRMPYDLAPVPGGQDVSWLGSEELYLTPAFWEAFHQRVAVLGTGFELRLRHGLRDLDAFKAAVRRLKGGRDAFVYANSDAERTAARLERAIRLEAVALLTFATAATATALLVLGQSIARQVQLEAGNHPVLRALGMTDRQLIGVALARAALIAVPGALLAAGLAALLSPLSPIGLARRADVAPGFAADLPVLAFGSAGLLLIVLVRAGLAGWAVVRASRAGSRQPGAQPPSRLADRLARAGGPPSAVIGVRLAFEPGRDAAAVPVRTAIVGAVVAVAAVVGALSFAASLGRLTHTPALHGWTWDVAVGNPHGPMDRPDEVARRLAGNPLVGGFSSLASPGDQPLRLGDTNVVALGIGPLKGAVLPPAVDGRQVRSADEIALGPTTLQRLGGSVGDVVEVAAGDRHRKLRIVGTTLSPSWANNDLTIDSGALLTLDGLRALLPDAKPAVFLVEYAPGAAPDAAFQSLRRDFGRVVVRPLLDEEVDNLGRVAGLPFALAGLLAALGTATLGHLLITSSRHRRRDLAVLKTLGFVRRQVGATVAWQATALAAVALAMGLPLGVAAGRWAWVLVNRELHSLAGPVTPTVRLLLVVPGVILAANLVAAVPARGAARTRPALVLRAE
jgi:hypothetical protein